MLGGAINEEFFYGHWSTGATNDFEQATGLAKQVITSGLSRLGIVNEDMASKEQIYEVMKEIFEEQLERVRKILKTRIAVVEQIVDDLLRQEKVSCAGSANNYYNQPKL